MHAWAFVASELVSQPMLHTWLQTVQGRCWQGPSAIQTLHLFFVFRL